MCLEAGIDMDSVFQREMIVWIDPYLVAYKIEGKTQVNTIYFDPMNIHLHKVAYAGNSSSVGSSNFSTPYLSKASPVLIVNS